MDEEEQQPMIEEVPADEDDHGTYNDDGNAGLDHQSDDCLGPYSGDDHHLVATNNSNSNTDSVKQQPEANKNNAWTWQRAFHTTLLPDNACTIRNMSIVEGPFTVKLFKFVLFTFLAIGFLHWLVSHRSEHRDVHLKFWEIWVYDGNLIASDCVVFFLVGRLWKQKGIDHLAWIGMVVLSNLYFVSQHYVSFTKHAMTMYEMSCVWPWKLWVFFVVVLSVCISVIIFHIMRAYQTRVLVMKLVEVSVAFGFYLAPLIGSPYFHPHHWYRGWLAGMHFNFDKWWSRLYGVHVGSLYQWHCRVWTRSRLDV